MSQDISVHKFTAFPKWHAYFLEGKCAECFQPRTCALHDRKKSTTRPAPRVPVLPDDDRANRFLTDLHARCLAGAFPDVETAENVDGDVIRVALRDGTTALVTIEREDEDRDKDEI